MIKKSVKFNEAFTLEQGGVLASLEITYHISGEIKKNKPVVWVCHALTGNSNPFEWWTGLFGDNYLFNPHNYTIICANVVGSCYGSTGPLSSENETAFSRFPFLTIRDMVAAHKMLANYLNVEAVDVLIGGSLGGQQALEWAILEPERIKNLICIATNAKHSPWGIALNETQRQALYTDKTFGQDNPNAGAEGLKVARQIALLSYRNYTTYINSQLDEDEVIDDFKASRYQIYQGVKLQKRFNAYSYYVLSKAMDSHNLARGRKSLKTALQIIKAKTLVVGISSDLLFPVKEQQLLAELIHNAEFHEVSSDYAHDGFLLETEQLSKKIKTFLDNDEINKHRTNKSCLIN